MSESMKKQDSEVRTLTELQQCYRVILDEVGRVIDVESGLAEILDVDRHRAFSDDLGAELDVDKGLLKIFGGPAGGEDVEPAGREEGDLTAHLHNSVLGVILKTLHSAREAMEMVRFKRIRGEVRHTLVGLDAIISTTTESLKLRLISQEECVVRLERVKEALDDAWRILRVESDPPVAELVKYARICVADAIPLVKRLFEWSDEFVL